MTRKDMGLVQKKTGRDSKKKTPGEKKKTPHPWRYHQPTRGGGGGSKGITGGEGDQKEKTPAEKKKGGLQNQAKRIVGGAAVKTD